FLFLFFWFIFKIFFINLFFISALCEKNKQHFETLHMPTKTSDTFKNILLEFLNFQEHFFREMGASFRKFSHLFFRFVFFVFVFLVYFYYFILLQLLDTLSIQTTSYGTFKNDRKQRSEDNS